MRALWTWTTLAFGVILWYSQPSSSSAVPESGLEKAAAASAVIAGSDASSSNGQREKTDLEARFKRITDTLDRTHGPDLESGDKRQSERLVVADRPPSSYQGGASQSPFMMKNDELGSSGDGALGDDDEGDDGNGEFGSGDDPFKPDDPSMEPIQPRSGLDHHPSPATEGVYPADLDEHTTKKPASPTTTKRVAGGRVTAGPTRKPPYVESEHRHPTPKPRPAGSSSSSLTLPTFSLWLRLLVSVSISLTLARLGLGR